MKRWPLCLLFALCVASASFAGTSATPTPDNSGWTVEFGGTIKLHKGAAATLSPTPTPLPVPTPSPTPSGPRPVVAGLDKYTLAFDEEFDGPLSIPPGTGWDDGTHYRWMCHTPYSGDFGDAFFSGPQDAGDGKSPFSLANGVLTITAWIDPAWNNNQGHWRSGLISSVGYDASGKGFSQSLGYWECRMKCPPGGADHNGVWPAFWLGAVAGITKGKATAEIDILEAYGVDMTIAHQNVHSYNTGQDFGAGNATKMADLSLDWHVFSCLVNPDYIHFYIDGQEVWKYATYPEAKLPLYCMVDLGLGGGWPSDKTPNPSQLLVDYVRVYAPPASPQ